MKNFMFLTILTLASILGLIASDIYLPAMPIMQNVFAASEAKIKQTLSCFLLGISICQLFYGSLIDRFGRKKVLIIGVFLYSIASILCVLATTINQLIVFRILQAVGACSGIVIARAIVGDLFSKQEGAKILTIIFPIVGSSPAVAPIIGSFLTEYFGWQANFYFIAILGLMLMFLTIFYLKESLPKEKQQSINFKTIFANYYTTIINKQFCVYAGLVCAAYGAYFSYITNSAFLLIHLGYKTENIGFFYLTLSLGYITGNLTAKKIINKISIDKALYIGGIIFIFGGLIVAISSLFESSSILPIITGMSILTIGNGFLLPLGIASSVSVSKYPGTASGLVGFLQLGFASLFSFLSATILQNRLYASSIMVFVAVIVAFICIVFIKKFKNGFFNKAYSK